MDYTDDVFISPWVMCLSSKKTNKGKRALVVCHDLDLQLLFFGPRKMRNTRSPEQTTPPGFVIDKELTHAVDHPRGPMYGEPLFSCEADRKEAMEAQRLHEEWHRRCFVTKDNRGPVNLPSPC